MVTPLVEPPSYVKEVFAAIITVETVVSSTLAPPQMITGFSDTFDSATLICRN